jgi:hypothetical protein
MVLVNNKLTNVHKSLGVALAIAFVVLDVAWCKQSYRFEFLGEHSFSDI